MKEFEKWWDEELTKTEKGYCMIAWEAALKWALLTNSWETIAQEIKEELCKTDATSEKRC